MLSNISKIMIRIISYTTIPRVCKTNHELAALNTVTGRNDDENQHHEQVPCMRTTLGHPKTHAHTHTHTHTPQHQQEQKEKKKGACGD